jgi:hypothetical protein
MELTDERDRRAYEHELNKKNYQMFNLVYSNILAQSGTNKINEGNIAENDKYEGETVIESDDEEEYMDEVQIFTFEE